MIYVLLGQQSAVVVVVVVVVSATGSKFEDCLCRDTVNMAALPILLRELPRVVEFLPILLASKLLGRVVPISEIRATLRREARVQF
mmetsp:Transcript_30703/g.31221  ORF Transcript_30703/g.31221 Transcript_30703/m.31221 type:complete len:86 (-) Transcript_30703:720-977(-)